MTDAPWLVSEEDWRVWRDRVAKAAPGEERDAGLARADEALAWFAAGRPMPARLKPVRTLKRRSFLDS